MVPGVGVEIAKEEDCWVEELVECDAYAVGDKVGDTIQHGLKSQATEGESEDGFLRPGIILVLECVPEMLEARAKAGHPLPEWVIVRCGHSVGESNEVSNR